MPSPRIAVVDNEPAFLEFVCAVLDDEGYATTSYQRSAEAYGAIRAQPPAAIILDVQMETLDSGLKVLALLGLDPLTAAIPVILCTARADVHPSTIAGLPHHACVILHKPFHLETLLQLVAAVAPLRQESPDVSDVQPERFRTAGTTGARALWPD
jgi:CheY-like chemotaxis protein